jgi:hypothetical protein
MAKVFTTEAVSGCGCAVDLMDDEERRSEGRADGAFGCGRVLSGQWD